MADYLDMLNTVNTTYTPDEQASLLETSLNTFNPKNNLDSSKRMRSITREQKSVMSKIDLLDNNMPSFRCIDKGFAKTSSEDSYQQDSRY